MLDPTAAALVLGGIAVAIGVIALAIAIWDDVRDRYYFRREGGPVVVQLERFDIPSPNDLFHKVQVAGTTQGIPAVLIRAEWTLWNKVSWPVYVSFPIGQVLPAGARLYISVRDEMMTEGPMGFFVPPRQPVRRYVWIYWPRDVDGAITLEVNLGGSKWTLRSAASAKIEWTDGRPALVRQDLA